MTLIQAVSWLGNITYNYKYYVNIPVSTLLVVLYIVTTHTHMILFCPLLLNVKVTFSYPLSGGFKPYLIKNKISTDI